jgi:hypothetical protein
MSALTSRTCVARTLSWVKLTAFLHHTPREHERSAGRKRGARQPPAPAHLAQRKAVVEPVTLACQIEAQTSDLGDQGQPWKKVREADLFSGR